MFFIPCYFLFVDEHLCSKSPVYTIYWRIAFLFFLYFSPVCTWPVFFVYKSWYIFIRPSSDGSYYGMVMSVRPSVHLSVLVSFRQSQFSAVFFFMLWRMELKLGMSLSCYEHSIKLECCQFLSSFVGVMPLLELKILEIHSFPQFSPTCCDILRWNIAYDFVLLYYRSSLSVVNFLQVL